MLFVCQIGTGFTFSITVYPNSIRVFPMDFTPEPEWPDEFSREEMLEQHAHLLEEECRMFQQELSRYRKNMARLIAMHTDVSIERDSLRAELKETATRLSDTLRDYAALANRIAGLEICREQLEALHTARRVAAHALPATFYPKR
ncbi:MULTISPECIES: hypothetical protein [unclassified Pseudomonas]|uniref:hypothetical protein n=1 Tax=unclassified Pseudomonas TaxID=196821 RepID=UPI0025D25AB7|nr:MULTISPECIES: hypothetical protein [unclassified Pseudomonas]